MGQAFRPTSLKCPKPNCDGEMILIMEEVSGGSIAKYKCKKCGCEEKPPILYTTEKKCPRCGSEDFVPTGLEHFGLVSKSTGEIIEKERFVIYRCKKCQQLFEFKEV